MIGVMSFLTSLSAGTPRLQVSIAMVVLGLGVGATIPLVNLAAQNAVAPTEIGTTTSTVSFARSIGSTVGIAAFGAVLNARLADGLRSVISADVLPSGVDPTEIVRSPTQLGQLPASLRDAANGALGSAISDVYLVGLPLAVLAFIGAWFLRELPLRPVAPIHRAQGSDQEAVPSVSSSLPGAETVFLDGTAPPSAGGV
jgi:hypothetical protein